MCYCGQLWCSECKQEAERIAAENYQAGLYGDVMRIPPQHLLVNWSVRIYQAYEDGKRQRAINRRQFP